MFFRRKNSDDQPPPPAWLTWGVLVFIGLAIVLNMLGIKPDNAPAPQIIKSHTTPNPSNTINWGMFDIDTYKARLMPGYGRLQITDTKVGEGNPAVCGQDVSIAYHVITPKNTTPKAADEPADTAKGDTEQTDKKAFESADKDEEEAPKDITLDFRLGDKAAAPDGLQSGVIGMRIGGAREIVVPAERSEDGQTVMSYAIKLLKASPEYPESDAKMPLRAYDKRIGMARSVMCGDTVHLHATLWDLSGNRLFSTHLSNEKKPIEFTLGDGQMMIGIEQGILDMQADSSRTLLIPSYLQNPLKEKAAPSKKEVEEKEENSSTEEAKTPESTVVYGPDVLRDVQLPDNQIILVDIELVP